MEDIPPPPRHVGCEGSSNEGPNNTCNSVRCAEDSSVCRPLLRFTDKCNNDVATISNACTTRATDGTSHNQCGAVLCDSWQEEV